MLPNHKKEIMVLWKYYKRAVLRPSVWVIIGGILFSTIYNHTYKSEWYSADTVIFMDFVYTLIMSFIICLFTASILLNMFVKVKQSIFLSGISWLLVPISFIAYTWWHQFTHYFKKSAGATDGLIFHLFITTPFIISLVWSFISYRKSHVQN